MAAEQGEPPAYFAGTSAEFQATADVLLQLQCGLQLPVHSVLLASTSPVLCDMLKMAASLVEAGSKALLPLNDVTVEEAVDILKARAGDTPSRSPAHELNAPCSPCRECVTSDEPSGAHCQHHVHVANWARHAAEMHRIAGHLSCNQLQGAARQHVP